MSKAVNMIIIGLIKNNQIYKKAMTYTNDDNICPLCAQSNRCDVKASSGCWCMNTQVPEALLAKIPAHLKGISCVCNTCITRYHEQQALVADPKKVS